MIGTCETKGISGVRIVDTVTVVLFVAKERVALKLQDEKAASGVFVFD